ncbi:LPS export ABC transporter permease LptF [uncultured Desulfuromonas sp.]|uniref:LPS export ABC transporter permease LptF n=1 Tax=uncultured Desulfuromonas sp. TaxID=181013 RepID=UPI00341B4851
MAPLPWQGKNRCKSGLQPPLTVITSAPMSATRIHRYIAREVTVPAGLGLLIFTFVLLMGRVLKLVEMVINKGVPAGEIVELFLSLMPAFLVITIPLAFLLGVLLAFSRLSADSEIIALNSSGVSLAQMFRPVLALSVLASLATGYLTLWAEPTSRASFRHQVFKIASSRASVGIQPRVFNDEFEGLVLYANDIQERTGTMEGLFISDEREGSTPAIILARGGRIISDREALTLTLRMEDGAIHRRPQDREGDSYQIVSFDVYDVNLNMGRELAPSKTRPQKAKEMTTAKLRATLLDDNNRANDPGLTAELHKRFALPMAPLLFALIGVPLGVHSSRTGRGAGFSLALGVALIYFLLFSGAKTVAEEGMFPPALAIWTPNILGLIAGVVLFRLTAQEKRPALMDWIPDRLNKAKTFFMRKAGR